MEAMQSFFLIQRLNVRTLSTLLQVLQPELERYVNHHALSATSQDTSLPPKISAVVRRVLPALRQYSSWLITNATILAADSGDEALKIQVTEFWKAYANVLTLLASMFSLDELQSADLGYLLEEDEHTLGFSPFVHEDLSRRYFKEDLVSQKPRHHDQKVERNHPNKEMLGRIRDFLMDGMVLHMQEVSQPF